MTKSIRNLNYVENLLNNMTTREYQEHDPEFAKKVQNMEQVASLAEMKDSLEQE